MDDRVDNFLAHYGVLGMHWGVHKPEGSTGVKAPSRKTTRQASNDAKEFARAKMYYGEGAGTRRKLIKATVESKAKNDPVYKKEFDRILANQDMSKHASSARSQRKRTDVVKGTAKTARGLKHVIEGNTRYASTLAVVLVGAYGVAKQLGADKIIANAGKTAYHVVLDQMKK